MPREKLRIVTISLTAAAVIMLLALAWALLLVTVSFGLERGEVILDTASQREFATRLNRASNVGLRLFVAVEFALAWLVSASGLIRLTRLHWAIRFIGIASVASGASYGLVLFTLSIGGAPDLILNAAHAISSRIMGIV
jgi:hypothetical protein